MSEPRRGDPRFYALLDELASVHERKSHDYAHEGDPLGNYRRSANFGVRPSTGILCRMSDKWTRLEQLTRAGAEPKNESLRDSLIDNAVMSLLCVILLEDETQ
jgi:hypothetical protein